MDFLGLQHPFFRPVWRRWLTVAFCFGWAAFELINGSPLWAMIFGALGVAAAWQFFLVPWSDSSDDEK